MHAVYYVQHSMFFLVHSPLLFYYKTINVVITIKIVMHAMNLEVIVLQNFDNLGENMSPLVTFNVLKKKIQHMTTNDNWIKIH